MRKALTFFLRTESGAVTTEWVVLTAAVVGLVISAYTSINSASSTLAVNTNTTLSTMAIGDPVIGD